MTSRRQNKRWLDADCPKGVLAIYDDHKSIDRYTVFYVEPVVDDVLCYVAMNAAPFHPQGFGQHGELRRHEVAAFRYRERNKACRWSDLPQDCKRLVRQDLGEG
jgi:hypothetical protein